MMIASRVPQPAAARLRGVTAALWAASIGLGGVFVTAASAGESARALEPWASQAAPSDVPRRHVEEISARSHTYVVAHGGTMDGTNCRGPMGCGMNREGAIEQTWQSNRSVRMENAGDTDVVDPWLSNGRNDFRTIDEIVASAVEPGMSDKEKALALWFQQITRRFHFWGDGNELGDPVKVFNVYGHNPCGSDACMMGGLWRRAGLRGAPVRLVSHAIAQAFYDGGWHVLDGDLGNMFLLRDNETVASDREIARDHDLAKRAHTEGILLADLRSRDEHVAAMFVCEEEIAGGRACKEDTTMNMTLRPGEALVWRWGRLDPPKCTGGMRPLYPDTVSNGLWEYRPDLSGGQWKRGADAVEGVVAGAGGLSAEGGRQGTIVWTMRSPYPFVGGRLEAEGTGAVFSVSTDGKSWNDLAGDLSLDPALAREGPARYEYRLRCRLQGGATLRSLCIVNDLQMALLALPEMTVGKNTFVYSDRSAGERKVRITHDWVERSSSRPPAAPASPAYPADRGEAEGTDVVFRWPVPADPDGDGIADYHFELSERADMKWPLSTNFYKLISRTADKGKAQYALPYVGLLTPDTRYYWHVRAKDQKGVWGPWSATWSFTPRGPGLPLEVKLDYDEGKAVGTLTWKPNPRGRAPARYRVYGSDEKGFSASDEPYKVNVGKSEELSSPFPANFIAETTARELAVLGPGVGLPAANRTYYRVVAVDGRGNRSGPSDYATAPRPVIYSRPVTTARVGSEYRYQVAANRSLGDLRLHAPQVADFWDVEHPRYSLDRGPAWLTLDAATGVLSGTPDAAGRADVAVSVTIDRQVRKLDVNKLGWGVEEVVETGTERVGAATQRFVIDIGR